MMKNILVLCGLLIFFGVAAGKILYSATPTDPKIWFDEYNQAYFLGALPYDTTVRYGNLNGHMGETRHEDGRFEIVIDIETNKAENGARLTLLHEECHVETWNLGGLDIHGRAWETCMHRLADAGAFDHLW